MTEGEIFYQHLIDQLNKRSLKYEVHNFKSGAIMIDIWHKGYFYVVQIYENSIGISRIDESDPGFGTVPDELFDHHKKSIERIDFILNS